MSYQTPAEQLAYLRAAVEQARQDLIEKEAELADRLAETNAFEFLFEAKVGHLLDRLEALETEIERYMDRLDRVRQKQKGQQYASVDAQYRRAWQTPPASAPTPPPQPPAPAAEAEIKRLYRQLARRFHPDLAVDETDRARRTEKMAAINNAYAARSLTELVALAQQADSLTPASGQTEAQMIEALQAEVERCQKRLRQIERDLRQLPFRPSVQLGLEVKLARRRGRDLLGEMAADLEQKIARKTVERDLLKAQFDQLGPEQGFIPIKK